MTWSTRIGRRFGGATLIAPPREVDRIHFRVEHHAERRRDETHDPGAVAADESITTPAGLKVELVAWEPVADGASTNGLERIATLLEQIEERRQLEARRTK